MREANPRDRVVELMCSFLYFEFFLRFQQTAGYFQSYVELGLLVLGLVGATLIAPSVAAPTDMPWELALASTGRAWKAD
jgi:hypothetical protein